jgi:Arc/MetJ family transcription regulator
MQQRGVQPKCHETGEEVIAAWRKSSGSPLPPRADPLDDADQSCIAVCMRTTLNLNDALLAEASDYAGLTEKTAVIHEGLRALIQREAAARLAALGGKDRKASASPRRKPARRR